MKHTIHSSNHKSIVDRFLTLNRFLLFVAILVFGPSSNLSGKSFDKKFFQKKFDENQAQVSPLEVKMIENVTRLKKMKGPTKINRTIEEFEKIAGIVYLWLVLAGSMAT